MKLNLGSGNVYLEGYINIDKADNVKCDERLNIDDCQLGVTWQLPYEDSSVEEILAHHILEHIHNIIPLMNECYRVLKPGCKMFIRVPQGDGVWGDPTHVRAFNKLSWIYYCGTQFSEIYGITAKFKQKEMNFMPTEWGGELLVTLEK